MPHTCGAFLFWDYLEFILIICSLEYLRKLILNLMKNNILILAALLVLASCSQKQFSFRKTIKVNQPKQQELVLEESQEPETILAQEPENPTPQETTVSEPTTAMLHNNMMLEANPQTEKLNTNEQSFYTPQVTVKVKAPEEKLAPQKAESKLNKKAGGDGSTAAILGFIFGIVGLVGMFVGLGLLSLLFLIAGLVLSIVGLKSSNRGLSLAGLIFSIVGLVLWVIIIVLLAAFISAAV